MSDLLNEMEAALAEEKQVMEQKAGGNGEATLAEARERVAARLAAMKGQRTAGKTAETAPAAPVPEHSDTPSAAVSAALGANVADIIQADDGKRTEVSASTIGRMLGLVTLAEFRVVEGKIDLVMTRVASLLAKLDRIQQGLNSVPTGSDLERIDVQIGALRSMIRDVLGEQTLGAGVSEGGAKVQGDKLRAAIRSNRKPEKGEEPGEQ